MPQRATNAPANDEGLTVSFVPEGMRLLSRSSEARDLSITFALYLCRLS